MNGKIRTLVFLGFTTVAATLSGCIIDDSSPSSSGACSQERYFSIDWNIQMNSNNAFVSCDQANASTVQLNYGNSSTSFPCSFGGNGGTTTSGGLAPGNYQVSMQLLSLSGAVLSDTAAPPGGEIVVTMPQCAPAYIPTVTFGI